jgi:hypothetical protein
LLRESSSIVKQIYLQGIEGKREGAEWVIRERVESGGRNDPSIICTYE